MGSDQIDLTFRFADNAFEDLAILTALEERVPRLSGNQLFLDSIPLFLTSFDYKRFLLTSDGLPNAFSFGLFRAYSAPRINRAVLGVEAIWFASDDMDRQVLTIRALADFAKNVNAFGVCIHKNSLSDSALLDELVKRESIGHYPVERKRSYLLQTLGGKQTNGVYSAFTEDISEDSFASSCVRIAAGT